MGGKPMTQVVVDKAFLRKGVCPLYVRSGDSVHPDPAYIVLQPSEGTITPMVDSVEGGHPFLQRAGVQIFSVPPNISKESLEALIEPGSIFVSLCQELVSAEDKGAESLEEIADSAQALIDETADIVDVYMPRQRLQSIASWQQESGAITGLNLHSVPGYGSILTINGSTSDQVIMDADAQVTRLLESHEIFEERPAEWFTEVRNFFKFNPRASSTEIGNL